MTASNPKGLVLSGGKGSRLRPFTYTGAKQLVPIANKPVLFYAIEQLVAAGVTDIGIVVGDTAEQIKQAVGDGSAFGARVTYIQQDAPRGIAHAIKIAQDFLGDSRFVLFLGDNFLRDGIVPYVEAFRTSADNARILLYRVPNPREFGVAELEDGRVVRVVEKPQEPKSDLAVIGIYFFDHHVFEAVNAIRPSARGELEITDTIQYLIDHGYTVRADAVESYWIDTGKMADILEANRVILETVSTSILGTVDEGSQVQGNVVLEEGATLVDSVVHGPAVIGRNTRIEHAYVGPFTSIYHDCTIRNAEIGGSVVLEHTVIEDLPHRIEGSLIGRFVTVRGNHRRPRSYRLVLGDHSSVSTP